MVNTAYPLQPPTQGTRPYPIHWLIEYHLWITRLIQPRVLRHSATLAYPFPQVALAIKWLKSAQPFTEVGLPTFFQSRSLSLYSKGPCLCTVPCWLTSRLLVIHAGREISPWTVSVLLPSEGEELWGGGVGSPVHKLAVQGVTIPYTRLLNRDNIFLGEGLSNSQWIENSL